MNKLKTGLLLFAILIASVCCSFYFEADYRRLIRYLYELTSVGKISFIVPKKYLHFASIKFTLSFSLFTTGLFLLLVKKTGRQILIGLALALFLFSLSAIVHTWLDGVFKLIECTSCDGTRRWSYYDVDYDIIFISSLFIAFLPALITEIKRFIELRAR
ncbi:hypothetical protein BH10BAC2_BH10BAC2_38710 [soil metagenome]